MHAFCLVILLSYYCVDSLANSAHGSRETSLEKVDDHISKESNGVYLTKELLMTSGEVSTLQDIPSNVTKSEMTLLEIKKHSTALRHDQSCPTWMYRLNKTSPCVCGSDLKRTVKCDEKLNAVSVIDCYCVTYDDDREMFVSGLCFYGCQIDSVYRTLPSNASEVNNILCGKLNRYGKNCAKCREGYYPLVYSYDFSCIRCEDFHLNWVKFVLVATLPSTLLFAIVLLCKINALSPKLHVFVHISQAFGAAINIRVIAFVAEGYRLELAKLVAVPYGFINLDFFRTYINTICVDLTTLQALSLDYITAVYPLLLVVLTYVFIQLHATNCRVIVWMWKPFRFLFSGNWDIHSSIIQTFATFLLLSYGKLLSVTFDLLIPTTLYNVKGEFIGFYLYYDASYEYFSHDHLPYAVLALIVSLTLIIPPPALLLVYPLGCFQRCLGCRNLALNTFVECFQGYFKDGTEPETCDCRWVSAVYFIVKILFVFLLNGVARNVLCYTLTGISVTVLGIIIMIVRPYKAPHSRYNTVDAALLFVMSMWCASIVFVYQAQILADDFVIPASVVALIISVLPLAYILTIILKWLCKGPIRRCCSALNLCFSRSRHQPLLDSK